MAIILVIVPLLICICINKLKFKKNDVPENNSHNVYLFCVERHGKMANDNSYTALKPEA